jgi:hypothetical protein
LGIGVGVPKGFSDVFILDRGAKGLKGGFFGDPNGEEEAAVGFGAKGFAVAGDDPAANRPEFGSAGGSANLTCLLL